MGGDSWVWLCAEEDPLGDDPPLACGGALSLALRQRSPSGMSSCEEGDDSLLICGDALDEGAGEGGEELDEELREDGLSATEGAGHDLQCPTTQSCCFADMLAYLPALRVATYHVYQSRIFLSFLSMPARKAAGGACPPADERAVCLVRAIFAVCSIGRVGGVQGGGKAL